MQSKVLVGWYARSAGESRVRVLTADKFCILELLRADDLVSSMHEWEEMGILQLKWSRVTDVADVQDEAYQGMVAASTDWVLAVTYDEISSSAFSTVFLSIGLAVAVVFVFCGPRMTIFAAITVLMINVTVMGVLWTFDWCAHATFHSAASIKFCEY